MSSNERRKKTNTAKRAAVSQPPKRVSRKSVKRKRIIKRIMGVVLGAVVVAASFYASAKLLFIVKTINVSGSDIFTPDEIMDFVDIPLGKSIFTVKTKDVEQKLLEEFTYLEEADVEKRFPDIIEILLTDSQETYYTVEENVYKVYSQSFKYLRNSTEPPQGTIGIEVDMQNSELLEKAKNLISVIKKCGMEKITRITVKDENSLEAEYDGRIQIKFGTELNIEYKIKMCNKIIQEKIPDGERGIINAANSGEAVYTRE